MSIQFECSHCNSTLKVADEHVGRKLKCPKCSQVMVVPSPEPIAVAPLSSMPSDQTPLPAEEIPTPVAPIQPQAPQSLVSSQPTTTAHQQQVRASEYIAAGTGFHQTIAYVVFTIVMVGSLIPTFGTAAIGWLIAWLTYGSQQRKAEAALQANAIELSNQQFPEIYQVAMRLSARLGLETVPRIFIMESNEQNAFALKTGSRQNVVLVDDIVSGAEATGNANTLEFIIAHELAHHALGHTGYIRGLIRQVYRPLSRLDEFSCDAVANAMMHDKTAPLTAITLLTVGPQLFPRVNQAALQSQVTTLMRKKATKKSEATLSHPHILRRYGALMGLKI